MHDLSINEFIERRNRADIHEEYKYLELAKDILSDGSLKKDRTGTGTYSLFDKHLKFDLRKGFPALTTKKLYFKTMVTELIWFLGNHMQLEEYKHLGRTNIKYLVDHGCNIWNDWPHKWYCENVEVISMEEFKSRIMTYDNFAMAYGNLGPVYGKQWRDWGGIDQIQVMIDTLKNNPDSRRNMVSAWNVSELEEMSKTGLPPCHFGFQVYSREVDGVNYLSLKWLQRSVDFGAGLPFNIASYGVLTYMLAQVSNHVPEALSVSMGDVHIYSNHVDQINEQLGRKPYKFPGIWINPDIKDINKFQRDDIKLIDYQHHPAIYLPIAV